MFNKAKYLIALLLLDVLLACLMFDACCLVFSSHLEL